MLTKMYADNDIFCQDCTWEHAASNFGRCKTKRGRDCRSMSSKLGNSLPAVHCLNVQIP